MSSIASNALADMAARRGDRIIYTFTASRQKVRVNMICMALGFLIGYIEFRKTVSYKSAI